MDKKNVLYIGLIMIGFVGLGRTLDNSVRFIENIFKPISWERSTLYYGQLITIFVIYRGVKGIIETKIKDRKSTLRSFVITILLIMIFIRIWNSSIQTYMGTTNNLTSLYNSGEDIYMHLELFDEPEINMKLSLENCSLERQRFRVKVLIPKRWRKYFKSNYVVYLPKEYVIEGKEELVIEENIKVSPEAIKAPIDDLLVSNELICEIYNEEGERRTIKHDY